jgi:hypothetical protein
MQESIMTDHRAKLFRPIVAGDYSRERQKPLPVASSQNQSPAVAARIAPVEFHQACSCLHATLLVFGFSRRQDCTRAIAIQEGAASAETLELTRRDRRE